MKDYIRTYTKPAVQANSSIYDANLIQSSSVLLNLYIKIQSIVTSLRNSLEAV